jgi:hypothetical protein
MLKLNNFLNNAQFTYTELWEIWQKRAGAPGQRGIFQPHSG